MTKKNLKSRLLSRLAETLRLWADRLARNIDTGQIPASPPVSGDWVKHTSSGPPEHWLERVRRAGLKLPLDQPGSEVKNRTGIRQSVTEASKFNAVTDRTDSLVTRRAASDESDSRTNDASFRSLPEKEPAPRPFEKGAREPARESVDILGQPVREHSEDWHMSPARERSPERSTQQTAAVPFDYTNHESAPVASRDPFPRKERSTRPKALKRTAMWKSIFRRMPRSAADGFQSTLSEPGQSVNKEDGDARLSVSAPTTSQRRLPPERLPPISINKPNARPEMSHAPESLTSTSAELKWAEFYHPSEPIVQRQSPPQRTKSRTSVETSWETQPRMAAVSAETEYLMAFRSVSTDGVDDTKESASEDEFGRWPTLPEEPTHDDADDTRLFDEWKRMQRLHAEQSGIVARSLWSEPPS